MTRALWLIAQGADLSLKGTEGSNALGLARHWHVTGVEVELCGRSGRAPGAPGRLGERLPGAVHSVT
ncbi:hypothetical protein ABT168_01525 [Streptomyces sp. NPDC001793]|uniref:hypothetical protein n=1 Tax=Streptomyces sp. NPDC001793 TaxID=3154657 RepID=UPI00332D7FA2